MAWPLVMITVERQSLLMIMSSKATLALCLRNYGVRIVSRHASNEFL